MAELAETNPKRFRKEWTIRLSSWVREANKHAGILVDEWGCPALMNFKIAEYTMEELMSYGEHALVSHAESTRELMEAECSRQWRRP